MAGSLNTPDVLTQPIAENGDKNTIPATNDQSLGQMSQSTGFPEICSERIADGGKAPRRADFNGAFNMLSRYMFFKQNGGIETFRADVSTAIGGYPKDAILGYRTTTEFKLVRSLIANNTYNFNTTPSYIDDGTHWESVIPMSKNIANWSSNVSNCITEIPQDINLTLSAGTLTLKAGSKVYVPNGFEQDGTTPKFDAVTVAADKTMTSGATWSFLVFYNKTDGSFKRCRNMLNQVSGNTAPATPAEDMFWYDTTNNLVKRYNGSDWVSDYSLPIGLITANGSIKSIDQVFNGFGFIGAVTYALPSIKCLIPDGRNTDGTLNNIIHTTSAVSMLTVAYNATLLLTRVYGLIVPYFTNYVDSKTFPTYTNCEWYNPDTNEMYHVVSGAVSSRAYACVCCKTTVSGGKITSLEIQYPFRAVDYNDFSDLKDAVKTNTTNIATLGTSKANTSLDNVSAGIDFVIESQLPTAENDYTWYRKYKSGWVEQGGYLPATGSGDTLQTVNLPKAMNDAHYTVTTSITDSTAAFPPHWGLITVQQQTTTGFKTYAGSDWAKYWEVKGMAA